MVIHPNCLVYTPLLILTGIAVATSSNEADSVDPKRNWNLQPGLIPPHGMWRGATIDRRFAPIHDEDPVVAFQSAYGKRLHIYRSFKTENYTTITAGEKAFIEAGGILFYSIQPKNWSALTDWHSAWKIKRFAMAIKEVAPAQVMIAPGYEADGHAEESQNNSKIVFGKAADYRLMFKNFRRQFEKLNVTNAIFVLDLSCNLRNHAFVLPKLYAGDDNVDWAFFNLFQSKSQSHGTDNGNCTIMAQELYTVLNNGVIGENISKGVGAWGTMNQTFGDPQHGYPPKAIPTQDRKLCLQQMLDVFEDRVNYPKLRAAIYFNSLNSMISPYKNSSYGSPELAPTLETLVSSSIFTVNDNICVRNGSTS